MKFKEYPDYKCFIKPRTSSMENKKENNYNSSHSTKKDLSEENFNKYISNYCTFYEDFDKSVDTVSSYLVIK